MSRSLLLSMLMVLAATGSLARAGGTPEHALIIVDPLRPDSMYLANYYRAARDIPDINVIYTDPKDGNYGSFDDNIDALLGYMANASIRDHIDFIVIAPTDKYDIWTGGYVTDVNCSSPLNRFSLSSAYTLALVADEVWAGGMTSLTRNEYYRGANGAHAFSSNVSWKNGLENSDPNSKQYFLGAQLGYTGERGNTIAELITMIDRSVAADGTSPTGTTPIGTFYFMETTDIRSEPRDGGYPGRVADLIALGAQAQHLFDVLPIGAHDCHGIMTGWASPGILTADMTLLPGAFCDHLTSWAATFVKSAQEKVSAWIAKGASGSWGTVEEPCAVSDKFPTPRLHVFYYKGLTLGESVLRSVRAGPFQGLLYGDPLTRPHTHIPAVSVPDAPVGTAGGTIVLTPSATTTDPSAAILRYELMIDGLLVDMIAFGQQFTVDTTQLTDGWHDLRVLAVDDQFQEATGRWIGALQTSNHGYSITLTPTITSGDLTTSFSFDVTAGGQNIYELRLIHNGRVIAAAASGPATLTAYGLTLGAGPARVQAEAVLPLGRTVRSAPVTLDIAFSGGTPSGAAPTARSYRKYIRTDSPAFVELPYDIDDPNDAPVFNVLSNPAQATLGGPTSAYRIVYPDPGAVGVDTFTFEIVGAGGTSAPATVTLVYANECVGDVDGDGAVDLTDLGILLINFGSGTTREQGDLSGDSAVDLTDLGILLLAFGDVCP